MSNLMRPNQPGNFLSLREAMDRLLEDSFVNFGDFPAAFGAGLDNVPALDVLETGDEVIIKAAVPGLKPEDIEVAITGEVLTIKGETRDERKHKEGQWHRREWRYGSFQRSLTLPTRVNADQAASTFENGVLTLTLPKAEDVRPRRLQVQVKQPRIEDKRNGHEPQKQ